MQEALCLNIHHCSHDIYVAAGSLKGPLLRVLEPTMPQLQVNGAVGSVLVAKYMQSAMYMSMFSLFSMCVTS